jgi:hypothetical protein
MSMLGAAGIVDPGIGMTAGGCRSRSMFRNGKPSTQRTEA